MKTGKVATALVIGVALFLASAVWASSTDFQNPQIINLLEKWNSNGTYAIGVSASENAAAVSLLASYDTAEFGWRVGLPGSGQTKTAYIDYDFGAPVTLGQVSVRFRATNHSPQAYQFYAYDNLGNLIATPIASGTEVGNNFDGTTVTTTLASSVTTSKLRFSEDITNDGTVAANQILGLGAYLATGQSLSTAGAKYNVFWDGVNSIAETGGGVGKGAAWINHTSNGNGIKPNATGSVTYELKRDYNVVGAMVSEYDANRFLKDCTIETSPDGSTWTQVFFDADWQFHNAGELSEHAGTDLGYMPFSSVQKASYVRLSWTANSNEVEINQFQLFGEVPPVPEPATLALVALGAFGLIIRRK